MRSVVLSLLLLLRFALPARAQNVDPTPFTHIISMKTVLESHHCSATAIGPHALLTASHCEAATNKVTVDGKELSLLALDRDGMDHTILFVGNAQPFDLFAKVDATERKRGDTAIVVGNPGNAVLYYRAGQYSGSMKDPDDGTPELMFNFRAAPGDSGGGIFDGNGGLYAVLNALINEGDDDAPMWVPVAFPLQFTKAQLLRAATFVADRSQHGPKKPVSHVPSLF